MTTPYFLAFVGLFLMLVTLVLQGMIAAMVKAKQPDAIPGKIDTSLSHESFVFRSNRTFMNSLENFPAMLASTVLAILIGASPFWSGIFALTYAIARIIHMLLYYVISTEKNPSPRSYFFALGLLANIALLVLCAITLFA